MSDSIGKVWLVGAGPGDAGLLTRKGYDVLLAADVVVYDALVGDGVLTCVPRDVRTIDGGKRAANHTMPQEQISRVLLDEALAGNKVVRLKGGDPFVFGRGGEELELLAAHGVPYEVVPGITSAIAVPAYNGIPVTHRDFTSSLHIVTGHKRAGADYDIDFDALVRTGGTLVFLMGVRALPDIMAGLMNAGMSGDTPAAVLQEGTTAGQRRIVATLSSYMVCPFIVEASDLIATMPVSIAKAMSGSARIVTLKAPLSLPAITVSLYWHERYQDDPAHAWLRQYLAGVLG